MMELTQDLVRELVAYAPTTGTLTWKSRDRKWFTSDSAWRRWNNRYANTPAFTYVHGGRRWGCILNHNFLAHRIAWLWAHGTWPEVISFKNGDATDISLSNMQARGADVAKVPAPHKRHRERIALAA